MNRLIFVLAVWMSLVSAVPASLTPRKERAALGKEAHPILTPNLSVESLQHPVAAQTESEFVVTERTEILLNGKPCKYEEVPGHASIVKMEVAADKKTVRKIHFRIRK